MNNNELLKAKLDREAEKMKDKFCADLKKLYTDNKVTIGNLSAETYIDGKNICDILNSKGDPQLTTIFKILQAENYTLVIVKQE